ncbi:hypothetical protein SKAU_G00275720 [Synaphobranchus kaupii]|uniref:Uncharacterized protein n=1 Tax=Synaphobranchus kaupii TaxID=118154 RepID=A0A9Q1F190_SYNKA|nr:hypothetical protein SKAU_G00275720 [Synaphobranchus kaupii]
MLQAEDADLHRAVSLLKDTIEVLSGFRQDFDMAKVTAKTLADKWGAQNAFEDTRRRKARRHFDELCEDERLSDGESSFRVNVFNANLDIVIHQLSNRFKSLRATSSLFDSIHPTTLANADDDALYETASWLAEHYSKDISASFPGQLLSFRVCFKKEIAKKDGMTALGRVAVMGGVAVLHRLSRECSKVLKIDHWGRQRLRMRQWDKRIGGPMTPISLLAK